MDNLIVFAIGMVILFLGVRGALRSNTVNRSCASLRATRKSNQENIKMKNSVMLTITSLLLILFLTFHLADDIRRGYEPGGVSNLGGGGVITVVLLFGTLVLFERRAGYIIMLLGSLFSLVVPVVHMKGRGVGVTSRLPNFSGHFF